MKFDYETLKCELAGTFSHAEIQKMRRPRVKKVVLDLSLVYVQALVGCTLVIIGDGALTLLLGLLLVGSAQHGMAIVAHEGAHGLLFKNKLLNDKVANFLFAAPILLPYNLYRSRHLAHHQHSSTDKDTKELYRTDISGVNLLKEVLKSLLLIDYFAQVLSVLSRASNERPVPRRLLLTDFYSILFSQLFIFAVFCIVGWYFYFIAWLYPNLSINFLIGKLRSIVEHRPILENVETVEESKYFLNTKSQYTKSVKATFFEKILFSKLNFHYHTVHHMFPTVSYQFYPYVITKLNIAAAKLDMPSLLEDTYLQSLRRFFASKKLNSS